jgi:polyphosphate kinase 2
MSKEVNPEVESGDRIVCVHMSDEYSPIAGGVAGTVVSVGRGPYDENEKIISVNWDNGRTLSLVSVEDLWMKEEDLKKEDESNLSESVQELTDKLISNELNPEEFEDLMSQLNDDDVTDLFLRNLDRKLLKSGDKNENVRKYISKYLDSIETRGDVESDPSDDFDVEDEFLYGGVEPEKSKIGRKQFKKELIPLQVELLKLQEHVKETGKPVVVVMEGRDSAGKGSTIRKMTEYLDPKYYNVVALGIATPEERKDWFGRYEKHIEPGKITFFDRSWYNRGIVEPVMGYGTEEEYFDFMENVNGFEQSLKDKGVELFKFWLSITPQTQQKRFELRKNSPLKYWKFSPNDEKSIDKWDDYTEYKEKVLKQTKEAQPWTVVDTNDKRAGTLNLLRHILQNVDYKDKDENNFGVKFPEVVTTVNESKNPTLDELVKLKDIFKSTNERIFFDFLTKIRDSGLVNMFDSTQFLVSGAEYLKKFIEMEELKGREFDEDMVEELLDLSEQTKSELVMAAFSLIEDEGKDDYSTNNINRKLRTLTSMALRYYLMMYGR